MRLQLLEEGAEAAEGGGELVGVVGGGVLELLKETIDGGTNVAGVGGLGLLAVGDIEGVEGHGGLFGGPLVGEGDVFGVVRDALEHVKSEFLVVFEGGQALCEALGQGGSGGRC